MAEAVTYLDSARDSSQKKGGADVQQLIEFLKSDNIAELLDAVELTKLGARCLREYTEDDGSMQEVRDQIKRGLSLAQQTIEAKNEPWPGAANVKMPMIAKAILRFASEAYSELIKGDEVCKVKHPGLSPEGDGEKEIDQRGKRVSKYLNYQLMDEDEEWEPGMDRLLHALPGFGTVHKKTWYEPTLKRQDTRICLPDKLTIAKGAKSLDAAPRISEELEINANDLYTRKMLGLWLDEEYACEPGESTEEKNYTFIEQHRWLDLDEDGYEEPYVVTFERQAGKIARIACRYTADEVLLKGQGMGMAVLADFQKVLATHGDRAYQEAGEIKVVKIIAVQHYTKYTFIPSLDGSYWDIGFFQLLGPVNETLNTLVNQILDAGSLANAGGGIISTSVRLKEGGTVKVQLGKWLRANISGKLGDSVFPWPTKDPSNVLFLMIGVITEAGNELAAVSDVMTGTEPSPNTPATTVLALIEQGKKVFSSIHKRIYRSLKSELGKLYRLNYIYADPAHYQMILNQKADPKADFNPDDMDVIPVASPELSSRFQKLAQASALRETLGMPGVDGEAVSRIYVDALGGDYDTDTIVPKPTPEDMIKAATVQSIKEDALALEVKLKEAELKKVDSETAKNNAAAAASVAAEELSRAQAKEAEANAKATDAETDAANKGILKLLEQIADVQTA